MRIAFISDIHEDIVSLRQAFRKIENLNCNNIICLGDISGFSAPHYDYYNTRNASNCLNLIREKCNIIIAGNHDLHAARKTPNINPEYKYPKDWYTYDFHKKLDLSKGYVWLYDNDELNPLYKHNEIDFIKTLPEIETYHTHKHKILLSHYCYPNLTGSMRVFYNFIDDFEEHQKFMNQKQCNLSFVGHRHFAGLMVVSSNQIKGYKYGKKHKLQNDDCIFVPAITDKRSGNGFCIFDSEINTVEAIRI